MGKNLFTALCDGLRAAWRRISGRGKAKAAAAAEEDLRQRLDRLAEAEARVRAVVDHVLDGIITINEQAIVADLQSGGRADLRLPGRRGDRAERQDAHAGDLSGTARRVRLPLRADRRGPHHRHRPRSGGAAEERRRLSHGPGGQRVSPRPSGGCSWASPATSASGSGRSRPSSSSPTPAPRWPTWSITRAPCGGSPAWPCPSSPIGARSTCSRATARCAAWPSCTPTPQRPDPAGEWARCFPAGAAQGLFAAEVLRSGRSAIVPAVTEEVLSAAGPRRRTPGSVAGPGADLVHERAAEGAGEAAGGRHLRGGGIGGPLHGGRPGPGGRPCPSGRRLHRKRPALCRGQGGRPPQGRVSGHAGPRAPQPPGADLQRPGPVGHGGLRRANRRLGART